MPTTAAQKPNEPLIQERMEWLNTRHICNTHGGQICLIPAEAEIPIFLQYGLKIEHLRLTDTDRRAWAEDIVSMISMPDFTHAYLVLACWSFQCEAPG
jgi:hypothetical protein